MSNTIMEYQKAFNCIVNRLKKDESIVAVMVFGSMVTGDLWEESDIDLFVITKENLDNIKNIYLSEKNVQIHVKFMSKKIFITMSNEDLKGGFMHRIFAASRLVFSRDKEITARYDSGRYYPDLDRQIWNLVYLCDLLKSIGICKKYLTNKRIYTAYSTAVKCAEDYSKLYINFSGYMISKDVMNVAINLNEEFREKVDNLFFNKANAEEVIQDMINYLEEQINKELRNITSVLIEYIEEKDCLLSAEQIKCDNLFKDFKFDAEEILRKLWKKNLIKRECREIKSKNDKLLFKENVYFI